MGLEAPFLSRDRECEDPKAQGASVEEDQSSLSLHLTYGINHAGLSCEGLLCCGVVEHMEGDHTTPCCPDVHDATKFG